MEDSTKQTEQVPAVKCRLEGCFNPLGGEQRKFCSAKHGAKHRGRQKRLSGIQPMVLTPDGQTIKIDAK